MELILIILSILAPVELSGLIAGLTFMGALIALYIKQDKDITEIKLTLKHDKNETDKEIALMKLQIDVQGKKDEELLSILSEIKTNQAVFDEKLTNVVNSLNETK